ncbi:hypothetical protein SAMN05216350_105109 [Polaromonas sp. YR568]|uniref:hypothetical protein n=1 Tax=Polaromonas sp. YR568 TaxID=1855301 RepID=UPI0008F2DBC1|nr:hypothetical protein [Polaromonas sp. YR568]SFU78732.1 hypothetical protein SAMN05216350_105109 [Polaromonas sp. YR568]
MDSELLRMLCALAAFGLPLAVAWWLAGRGDRPDSPSPEKGEPEAQQERPRCYPLRSDL